MRPRIQIPMDRTKVHTREGEAWYAGQPPGHAGAEWAWACACGKVCGYACATTPGMQAWQLSF